jgi:hypothetical protein
LHLEITENVVMDLGVPLVGAPQFEQKLASSGSWVPQLL